MDKELEKKLKDMIGGVDEGAYSDSEIISVIEQELSKAREEGKIEGRLEALPITIEEVKKAREEVIKEILDSVPMLVSTKLDGYEGEGWVQEDDIKGLLSKLNK